MADDEHLFPSTTWKWKRVKMRPSAGGQQGSTRTKAGFRRLSRLPRTESVRVTLTYRGGAESWWLVQGRGTHEVFPGWMALEDVMRRVFSEG